MNFNQNNLKLSSNPYLLQHSNNPIWWQSWNKETLEFALTQKLPIFLSIGYSSCHWCHVMEHESFCDETVANSLNQNFVSIKVDREELPDIDALYMTFVMSYSGHGGWPMSVILTPDLKPFFAATYLQKGQFLHLLHTVIKEWKNNPIEIQSNAENFLAQVKQNENRDTSQLIGDDIFNIFLEQFSSDFDSIYGGYLGAPKFPPFNELRLLSKIDKNQFDKVELTLDKILHSGIYDQIGGGIHRYATDENWMIPHFEKMLYDQAQFLETLSTAYKVNPDENYKITATEILGYIKTSMTDPFGGFYSSEDADSENLEGHKEEGAFYVWKFDELKSILSADEFTLINKCFDISEHGNFEYQNIFHFNNKSDKKEYYTELKPIFEKLYIKRELKPKPFLDKKIITEWNSLMISSLISAYKAFDDETYLNLAVNATHFLIKNLRIKNKLFRTWLNGDVGAKAVLKDYALLIKALVDVYQITFDESLLKLAFELQNEQEKLFYDVDNKNYFESSNDTLLIKQKDFYDNVVPASLSIIYWNLIRFYHFTYDEKYLSKSRDLIHSFGKKINQSPRAFAVLLWAHLQEKSGISEISIVGPKPSNKQVQELIKQYDSNYVIAFGNSNFPTILDNKSAQNNLSTYYMCKNKVCSLPLNF